MEKKDSKSPESCEDSESEKIELVLFQVSECYVYLIPPRKSAASYRADEWDVNKWAWDGILKVISQGEECIIKLEDKATGELYARAFLRDGEPHPVESVIDSSRYFVLRIEEKIGDRTRHAFIGIGFRERTEAYDFQAALHDHMKYLDKKKTAEEMDRQFQSSSSLDYSLKDGETIVLSLKKTNRGGKLKVNEHASINQPPDDRCDGKEQIPAIMPPPPPPALSPVSRAKGTSSPWASTVEPEIGLKNELDEAERNDHREEQTDDDFGDFQAAS